MTPRTLTLSVVINNAAPTGFLASGGAIDLTPARANTLKKITDGAAYSGVNLSNDALQYWLNSFLDSVAAAALLP